MDNQISEFCSITGADPITAEQLLNVTENNMELAIQLYLEELPHRESVLKKQQFNRGTSEDEIVISDIESSMDQEIERAFKKRPASKEDESDTNNAILYDLTDSPSSSNLNLVESHVPRQNSLRVTASNSASVPITTTKSSAVILDNPWEISSSGQISSNVMNPIPDREESHLFTSGSFPSTHPELSPPSDRARKLADLFRPPLDIIYTGTLEDARKLATIQSRWILLNYQDVSEFICQALNRDLWSDKDLKLFIKENFLFLQISSESSIGKRYIGFYPVSQLPHIALIDPITGERVKIWSRLLNSYEFMQELAEFLDTHKIIEDTHDSTLPSHNTDVGSSNNNKIKSTKHSNTQAPSNKVETIKKSSYPDIIAKENTEPSLGSDNATKVQFRLIDGSKIVRSFYKNNTVQTLFEYILFKVPELRNIHFDLLFLNTNLSTKMNDSLQEAGLQNALISLIYL